MATRCWICNLDCADYVLLPEIEDTYILPRDYRTYLIKKVNPFEFLYYIVCYTCMDGYLFHFPIHFKRLIQREIREKY